MESDTRKSVLQFSKVSTFKEATENNLKFKNNIKNVNKIRQKY